MKPIHQLLVFLFGITFIAGCKSQQTSVAETPQFSISDSLLKTLEIDTVQQCQMVNAITLTGKISFDEDKVAKIFPMVSGNITGVTAQLGDQVTKGQVLGIINSGEMAGYGTDLANAKSNLLMAKKNLDVSQDMFKSGLIAQKDLLTATEMYDQAQAQLKRDSQVININGGNTNGEFVVKAPISGFLVEKQVNNNMSIRPDNNNDLFTISDLKDVWVIANVYESNISQVHVGDSVEVTTLSYPGKIFSGKIDKVLNVLDPTNKVMKIKVILPNPGYLLKPEMFASVTVIHKENYESLCVPSQSLIFDQSRYFILVLKSPKDIKTISVQLMNSHAGKSYVQGNLQEGDKVIATNAVLIYNQLNQ
jgi:cobalt-zinc-cadmium efflux system membrane fusion protein